MCLILNFIVELKKCEKIKEKNEVKSEIKKEKELNQVRKMLDIFWLAARISFLHACRPIRNDSFMPMHQSSSYIQETITTGPFEEQTSPTALATTPLPAHNLS